MKMPNTKSAIVIGAGPAGILSAYLLTKQGWNVILLDKKKAITRKVCGEYLTPMGVRVLKQIGFYEELSKIGSPLYGMKIVSPGLHQILSFFPNDKKEQHGLSINRQYLDSFLLKKYLELPSAKFVSGTSVQAVEKTDGLWNVKTENGEFYRAELLIAADGLNSKVAKILGHNKINENGRIALHCFLPLKNLCDYTRIGQMHIFKDGAYCGLDPISPNEINFSIVCYKDQLKAFNSPTELMNYYIEQSPLLLGMFEKLNPSQEIKSLFPISSSNSFLAGEQLAYVGDAAGFLDPLTGEGMTYALSSAQLLANELHLESDIGLALENYKKKKKQQNFQKGILNRIFQYVIRSPFLCYLIANFLKKKQERANIFIGVVGNIYSPIQGLKKLLF
ncbi:MAG: FAD-dependent monooxygenase [Bacteriovoracaceae bacterium]|nr:FAD-dependent monooxygenase [Bacteriovoracaceae bacterium]